MTVRPARQPGAPGPLPVAALPRRLAALLYELLLLVALAFVTGFVLSPLTPRSGSGITVPDAPVRALYFLVVFAVLGAYALHFWSRGRRTLPMKTWSLRLARHDGGPVSASVALVRYLAAWIGPALAIAAYLPLQGKGHAALAAVLLLTNVAWALLDRSGQFLHDRLAGTVILDARTAGDPCTAGDREAGVHAR